MSLKVKSLLNKNLKRNVRMRQKQHIQYVNKTIHVKIRKVKIRLHLP